MSLWSESNPDFTQGVDPSQITPGNKQGFLGGFEQSYDEQSRDNSSQAISRYMGDLDNQQRQKYRALGIDLPSLANDPGAYDAIARNMVDGTDLGAYGPRIKEYNDAITAVRNKQYTVDPSAFPDDGEAYLKARTAAPPDMTDLLTTDQMFNNVRQSAQSAAQTPVVPNGFTGTVGGFVGGMAAQFDPRNSPTNLPAAVATGGSFGAEGALARIGAQAGGQGATELLNQLSGVQEQRRLLGLPNGPGEAAASVGEAALGGAALEGVHVGLGSVGRKLTTGKWFDDPEAPPAPPQTAPVDPNTPAPPTIAKPPDNTPTGPVYGPPDRTPEQRALVGYPDARFKVLYGDQPYGDTRIGAARAGDDAGYVQAQLEDWNGQAPFELDPPSTSSAIDAAKPNYNLKVSGPALDWQIDALARETDPETFRMYDTLATQVNTYRGWLDQLAGPREAIARNASQDLTSEIARLQDRIPDASPRLAKKYNDRVAELQAHELVTQRDITSRDTPDMTLVRQKLQETDQRMRDLAPAVTRAYSQARGKWDSTAGERDEIRQMMQDAAPAINKTPLDIDPATIEHETPPTPPPLVRPGITQNIPELNARPDVVAQASLHENAGDMLSKVLDEKAKIVDDDAEQLGKHVAVLLAEKEPTINVDGYDTPINMDDVVTVPNEDGTGTRDISVRQMLREVQRDSEQVGTVRECSI